MMFTSPMKLLTAVALDKDTDAIAQRLLESGAMDLVSVKDLSCEWKDKLAPLEARMSLAKLAELRKRVEGFMDMASPPISRPSLAENRESVYGVAARRDVDTDALSASLDALAADVNGLRERQKQLQDEILKLDEICRQLDAFDDLKAGAAASSTYSFLSIRAGILPQGSTERLEKALAGFPSVSLPSGQRRDGSSGVILISLKKDAARIEPALERLGWEDARLPDSSSEGKAEALRELAQKIDALRAGQGKCSDELKDYFRSKENFLRDSWAALRAEELVSRLRSSFARTDRTVLFSGWIPAEKAAQVEAGIRDAAKAGCVIEWIQPERDEAAELSPPVEMRNPGILKPFEGLVRNYAVPAYGSVDPTPFVALAYLMMFGLMFGDAGHGLVVALLGLGGIALARRKKKPDGQIGRASCRERV